jgi:AcrR family transcriptional regulator
MTIEPLTPERRRQQTRNHLLAAAAQVFSERGFHGASLDQVAAVAGFSKGAVYSNFESKEDLFLALFKAISEKEIEALHATVQGSEVPPEARLSDFIALIREDAARAGETFGLLYQEFWLYAVRNPKAREQLIRLDDENVRAVAKVIESDRKRQNLKEIESLDQIARIIIVLFRGITLLGILQPEVADDMLLETAIRFVARGLGVTL